MTNNGVNETALVMEPLRRMSKDIAVAAATITVDEARFLVDAYYIMQEDRKRTGNQKKAAEGEEPNSVIAWLHDQSNMLERQIKRALDKFSSAQPIGVWMKAQYGIGPVIASGLIAHIDIEKAPTVGHIWRFAGLDPTCKWNKGERRPFNASLKTLCWKIGQSFMKFHNDEECYYGHIYAERKAYEISRNDRGDMAETAALILTERKIGKTTDAFAHYSAGHLPPAQIDARARRYAVKLFLSHMHDVWYRQHFGKAPPLPYPIAHLGHSHYIAPPLGNAA